MTPIGEYRPDPPDPGPVDVGSIYDQLVGEHLADPLQDRAVDPLRVIRDAPALVWGYSAREFTRDDGSTYYRVDPDDFDDFDAVDSRTIVDPDTA